MKTQFYFCLVISLAFNNHASLQSIQDNNNYRAAKYSFGVDFSKYKQAMPDITTMIPESTYSYIYYIQYGKDTLIELLDPGYDILAHTHFINVIIYSKRESLSTVVFDKTREFARTLDTINYSIEESRGTIKDLCDGVALNSMCDSVTIILYSTKTEYKVFFNDTLANLRSEKLLYPNIKYLPYKIIRMDRSPVTFNLEEVIFGKPAVDSLLHFFTYEGYRPFNVDVIDPADRKMIIEFIEGLECIEDK